jgi:signal transduction histidine kinase
MEKIFLFILLVTVTVLSLYTIRYKKRLSVVMEKNSELLSQIQHTKEHTAAIEELAAAQERKRIAGDVHDSVGHTMAIIISLISVCTLACQKNDIETVRRKLDDMMKAALKGQNELKHSVQGILLKNEEASGIVHSIHSLVEDFKKTGVKVDFTVDGYESSDVSVYGSVIYRVCFEGLTNALKHGQAKQVNILLRFTNELISLYIFDDGIGCKEINKNMGLLGMEERVLAAGGKISFGSDGEKGFNIHVEIPLNRQ